MFYVASKINKETNLQSTVHLRLTADNPAEILDNESFICKRIAEAMIYGWLFNIKNIYCDTLATNDRGYFPREGVLDRLYNPKKGFYMIKHLHALLSSLKINQMRSELFKFSENNGNSLLQINCFEKELILMITKSEDWFSNKITKLLFKSQKELQRVNWISGELEKINASSLTDAETNTIEDLRIELILVT